MQGQSLSLRGYARVALMVSLYRQKSPGRLGNTAGARTRNTAFGRQDTNPSLGGAGQSLTVGKGSGVSVRYSTWQALVCFPIRLLGE